MKAAWWVSAAAGVLVAAAPVEVEAQGRSGQARAEQEARQAERDRMRAERDNRAQDVRNGNVRPDARAQADARQQERQRQQERDRLLEERRRQQERDRLVAERRRQEELERQRREYERRYGYDRWDDRRDDRRWDRDPWGYQSRARDHNGPPFCRSGQGHPVHGRRWCHEKGYGLGWDRWDRDGFGRIVLRQPRQRQQTLGRSVLGDILGDVIYRRFESYGHNYGRGAMTGHWVDDWGVTTLQLNIGGVPFARLVDSNRDGIVDRVLLRN